MFVWLFFDFFGSMTLLFFDSTNSCILILFFFDSTILWLFYCLILLFFDATLLWLFYSLSLPFLHSTIFWLYFSLTLLFFDSVILSPYYSLTLQCRWYIRFFLINLHSIILSLTLFSWEILMPSELCFWKLYLHTCYRLCKTRTASKNTCLKGTTNQFGSVLRNVLFGCY